jgi:hypothetical protein
MMQAIMWIILVATVGLAALVDRARARPARPELELGPPKQFEGFSVRLPKGWEEQDGQSKITTRIAMSDPQGEMNVNITARPRGLGDLRRGFRRSAAAGKIDFGGVQTDLQFRQISPDSAEGELSATRPLGADRVLSISLRFEVSPDPTDLEDKIELVKQIGASVKVDGNDNPVDPGDGNQ